MRLLPLLLILLLSSTAVTAEEPSYIGIKQCKLCHQPHYDSWDTTRMSKAFMLLQSGVRSEQKKAAGLDPEKDYTADPNCLTCHTTGYGKEGGFVSLELTPGMANVQCEMCHGPGSIYAEMMLKKRGTYTREDYLTKGGMTMPSEEGNVCTEACHNPRSPFIASGFKFNFENRKDIGTHRHDIEFIDNPLNF
jgi:hypothetical protein